MFSCVSQNIPNFRHLLGILICPSNFTFSNTFPLQQNEIISRDQKKCINLGYRNDLLVWVFRIVVWLTDLWWKGTRSKKSRPRASLA